MVRLIKAILDLSLQLLPQQAFVVLLLTKFLLFDFSYLLKLEKAHIFSQFFLLFPCLLNLLQLNLNLYYLQLKDLKRLSFLLELVQFQALLFCMLFYLLYLRFQMLFFRFFFQAKKILLEGLLFFLLHLLQLMKLLLFYLLLRKHPLQRGYFHNIHLNFLH